MTISRLLAFFCACSCLAADCTWMNSATASDLLGGPARVTVTNDSCNFRTSLESIHIQVQALPAAGLETYQRHCMASAPLSGLGNEAFACRVKTKKRIVAERIAGRVRNQAFVVEVSTTGHLRPDKVLEVAKQAAGQVAGNLF